jgi:hypothetical protein
MRIGAMCGVLMVLAMGCFPQAEDAPGDLDGLAHWFWTSHHLATDEQLIEAVAQLQAELEAGLAADEKFSGTLSKLEPDDLAATDIEEDRDLDRAQGLFIGNRFACDMEKLDTIVTSVRQDENYPDVYESYKRTYRSDEAAYFARDESFLTWHTEVTAAPVSAAYHSKLNGGVRWVASDAAPDENAGKRVPAIVQFGWFTEPADFEDENSSFDQDYQLEVYFNGGDGQVYHLMAMWRDMVLGLFSIEDDVVIDTTLNGLFDWDERTEELCAQ